MNEYDSSSGSDGQEEEDREEEPEPFDDTRWVSGAPPKTVVAAMCLPQQCWSSSAMLSEFLTASEVGKELADNARPLRHASPEKLVQQLVAAGTPEVQRDTETLRAVCAAAVGVGCETAEGWKKQATLVAAQGALPLLLLAFSSVCRLILPAARQDYQTMGWADDIVKPTERTAPLALVLRAVCNGIAGIFLGTGIGVPHDTSPQALEIRARNTNLIRQVAEFDEASGAEGDFLTLVVTLIRDSPAAPGLLPGKKLVLLAHMAVAVLCGPMDLTPGLWKDPASPRTDRWVGDGVLEQYIASVLNSSGTCSRLRFISADLLRSCYYSYLNAAQEKLESGASEVDGTSLAVVPSTLHAGIPLPVREGLAVLACKMATSLVKRRDAEPCRSSPAPPLPLPLHVVAEKVEAAAAGDGSVPDIPELCIPDPRWKGEASLYPEYPLREEEHLQPRSGHFVSGTPSPRSWPASHDSSRVPSSERPASSPAETLFRRLRPVLPGVVVGVFKLFLSSLPPEGDTAKSPSPAPVHEASSCGATSPDEVARQRNITIKSVAGFLLHVVKVLSKHSPTQAEVLLQSMADSNGLLLLLKYLHQNSVYLLAGVPGVGETGWDEAIELPCPLQPYDRNHVPWGATEPAIQSVLPNMCRCLLVLDVGQGQGVIQCDARNLLTCSTVLRLVRKLVRRHPSRLAQMLFYKMHILVRRKLRVIHPLLTLYGLKLLGDLSPHMGRKWRTQNTKALSQLYRYLAPSVPDTCAATFSSIEPYDPSTDLPVHPEQMDLEAHIHRVTQEYTAVEYPLR